MIEGKGEALGITYLTNWLRTQQRRRRGKTVPMATAALDLGKNETELGREVERGNGGGDDAF